MNLERWKDRILRVHYNFLNNLWLGRALDPHANVDPHDNGFAKLTN